jgi:hypothetical protein
LLTVENLLKMNTTYSLTSLAVKSWSHLDANCSVSEFPLQNFEWDIDIRANKIELVHISFDEYGNKVWTLQGKLHRSSGPAEIRKDGTREWWLYGKLHRKDGPAIDRPPKNGYSPYKEWWLHGKRHRVGGPSVDGGPHWQEWHIHGREFTEREFYLYVDQLTGEVLVPPGKKLTWDGNSTLVSMPIWPDRIA